MHFDIGPYSDVYLHFGNTTTGYGINLINFRKFYGLSVTGLKISI